MRLLVGSPHPVDEARDSLGGNFLAKQQHNRMHGTINQPAVDRAWKTE